MFRRLSLFYTITLAGAGLLGAVYFTEITLRTDSRYIADMHTAIIGGVADSPYRYRFLGAWLVEAIRLFVPGDAITAIDASYVIAHAIVFPLMLVVVYQWFCITMPRDRAAFAAMLLFALLPLGLMNWSISFYTALEVLFVALACMLAFERPTRSARAAYALLLIAAVLNRETGGALALIWILVHWRERQELRFGALLVILFLAEYMGMRLILGNLPHNYTITNMWAANTGEWLPYALRNNAAVLPIWGLALVGWKRADSRVKPLMLAALVYLVTLILFGMWHEVRLHFPALVLLLPIAFGEKQRPNET